MDLIKLAKSHGAKLFVRTGRIGRRKDAEIHFTRKGRVVCRIGEAFALVTDIPGGIKPAMLFAGQAKALLERHSHLTRIFCAIH